MIPYVSLPGGIIVLLVLANNLIVWKKWGWHWSTIRLRRNLCMILWRMIQEISQLNAQISRQSTALGGLHASRFTHSSRFAIKKFNHVHTCGEYMGTDGDKRARKRASAILQSILKQWPTYRSCDAKRDLKAQFGVTFIYDKFWWGNELAQNDLYGLARQSYDSLRWWDYFPLHKYSVHFLEILSSFYIFCPHSKTICSPSLFFVHF